MIHYHGTPITPLAQLLRMAGRHFCVSHAAPRDLQRCLGIGQSVLLDNGAYSHWKAGTTLDVDAYYRWIEPVLCHPHWAVIPDAIDADIAEQQRLLATWPRESLGYKCAAPVFHLHLPLHHLNALVLGYEKVCLGSSGAFAKVGSDAWCARMDEIFNYLAKQFGRMPWIHGLRMLDQTKGGWPLASADSTNAARFKSPKSGKGCPGCIAARVDAHQSSPHWRRRDEQVELSL